MTEDHLCSKGGKSVHLFFEAIDIHQWHPSIPFVSVGFQAESMRPKGVNQACPLGIPGSWRAGRNECIQVGGAGPWFSYGSGTAR